MSSLNLERRMLLAALVWLILAWGLGGTALSLVFRAAVVDRFDSKLEALVEGLAGYLAPGADGRLTMMRAHPNFGEPGMGWYWIIDEGSERTISSPDTLLRRMSLPRRVGTEEHVFTDHEGPAGMPLRALTTGVRSSDGRDAMVTVLLDRREIDREVTTFTSLLAGAAILLGVVLLAGILAQSRFALAPLRRLRGDLAEVEAGRLECVPENYPSDIRPVAEAINGVLERDQALAAWARKSAGNLAHALKTELALLRQLARELPDGERMVESTDRITGIVDHHLSRATTGPEGSKRARADSRKVIAAVVASLERIFAGRTLAIQADMSAAPDFRGEVHDLEEIVGNVLENACRHARSEVRARAFGADGRLILVVEDDGQGLAPTKRELATRRGERLDEKGPGTGLGLAIVNDLVELYRGELSLGESRLGGLLVRIELPAVVA